MVPVTTGVYGPSDNDDKVLMAARQEDILGIDCGVVTTVVTPHRWTSRPQLHSRTTIQRGTFRHGPMLDHGVYVSRSSVLA